MNNDEVSKSGIELDVEEDVFHVLATPVVSTHHEIYLSEHIESNFAYTELLHGLRHTPKTDKVTMYVANYGGLCSTGFQLVNAMKACAPGVDVVLDAPSYSMGAIIAISGKSLVMNPGTFIMFHNYSGGSGGKGKESLDGVVNYYESFHRHMNNICTPFLTKKELKMLALDQDVYVNADDPNIGARIRRHFK
jgi:ATP-dependent protease ClpP protease subunit